MNYRKVKYVVLFTEDRMAPGVFHNLDHDQLKADISRFISETD